MFKRWSKTISLEMRACQRYDKGQIFCLKYFNAKTNSVGLFYTLGDFTTVFILAKIKYCLNL